MIRSLSPIVLLSAVVFISPQFANATPVQPSAPVSGWLYDETYNGFGSTIKDSFGTMNGLTAVGSTSNTTPAPGGPTTSSDTPFSYIGNTSFSTIGGPVTGNSSIWHGSFGIGPYRALASGAKAVTVSAWVKYADGALSTGGTDSQNRNANAFIAMTLDGAAGGSGVYINLPTNGASNANKNKLLVGGQSNGPVAVGTSYKDFMTTGTLTPGQWNLIVGVLDFEHDQIRVSLNGGAFETSNVSFGSTTVIPGPNTGTTPDIIPARSPNAEYIGLLDEIGIWTTALNEDNVAWLQQNSLSTVPEPGSILLAGLSCMGLLGMRRIGRGKSTVNRG